VVVLVEASNACARLGNNQSKWFGIEQATFLDALLDEGWSHDARIVYLSRSEQETLAFLEAFDLGIVG